jgi:competence protein ComEC
MGQLVGGSLWAATALALAATVHLGVARWWTVVAALVVVSGVALRVRRVAVPRRARAVVAIGGAVLVLGSGVVTWRVVPLVDGPLAPVVGSRAVVTAELVATSDPAPRQGRTSGSRRTDDAWQLDAALVSMAVSGGDAVGVDLPVRVLTTEPVESLLPGTRLRAVGRLLSADPIHGRAATLVAESLTVVAGPPLVQGAAGAVRSALRDAVRDRPPDQRGLLPGLVVGDTSEVRPDLDTAMRDSSLAHLVAVSGGNVAVIVLLALGAVRLAGVRRGRTQVVLVALAVAAYVVVARPQPSVVRAAGMTAVILLIVLVDARIRPLDALGWSVGGLVLLDPFLALSVGFAMSAAATAGLLVLASRWRSRGHELDPWPRRAGRAVLGLVAVSAAAQLAVAPLIAGIGGGIPVGGVVANLLAEPAVGPATSFGVVAALVGVVSPPLATVVALPAAWAVGWVALVARTTADLAPPLPWPEGWYGALLALAVLALAGVAVLLARAHGGSLARVCLAMTAVGGLLTLAPTAGVPLGTSWPPPGWRIVMCDVGQGDAAVLETAPGEAVVVDTGADPALVDRCLRRLGISRVALLVLSHFHADHVEGVPGVLRGRVVSAVVVSPLGEPPTEDQRVLRWLDDAHVPWRVAAPGDRWTIGDVRLRVIWPTRILRGQGSDPNNASVAMVADVGGVSVLLGGDLETAAQEQVVASGAVPRVDVVKVPHHGSAKQAPGWALAARPRIALIGVGVDNDYGHPNAGTVNAYRVIGAVVGRTDLDGDVAVLLDDAHHLGLVRRGPG